MHETRAVVKSRRSHRDFASRPVAESELRALFEDARHAPSWCNLQPWKVWLASGETAQSLSKALEAAYRAAEPVATDFPWPPRVAALDDRRRSCGIRLYEAMGVMRNDADAKEAAWCRNFSGFGAPHLAIVTIPQALGVYGALDAGMWVQTLLLLAEERGLATCPQASLAKYPEAVRSVLSIDADRGILLGVSIGYASGTEVLPLAERAELEETLVFC